MELDISGYKVLIDDEDWEKVSRYKWHIDPTNLRTRGKYYFTTRPYINGKRTTWKFHRFIMGCAYGGDYVVDHINGDTLDNRKQNLRFCTHTENHRNSKVFKNNRSGYKGVGFHVNKWRARIMYNKNPSSIGGFSTPEEAAKAYDRKALELFGKFAYTNFPKENYIKEGTE